MVGSEAYDKRADAENYKKDSEERAQSPSATSITKRIAKTIHYGLYDATSRSDAYQKGWAMCMDANDTF